MHFSNVMKNRPWLFYTLQVQDYYYAPSILKEKAPSKLMTPSEDYKSTTILGFTDSSKFVHPALFDRLLAACLIKWPIEKLDNKNLIFCGCGLFEVDKKHVLTIYFLENLIRIWVTKFEENKSDPSVSVCTEVREFLEQTLSRIAQHSCLASKIETFVKCPRDKGLSSGFISLSEFNKNDEVPCKSHQQRHGMVCSDMLRFWYGDDDLKQISPGGHSVFSDQTLDRVPTEKEISTIARRIGDELLQLILQLGIKEAVYQQARQNDPHNVVNVGIKLLVNWTRENGLEATFRKLETAMRHVGINTTDVFKGIGEAQR